MRAFSWLAATVPNLRSQPSGRRRDDEVVGQLVEGPLDAEVRAEREGEDERVGRHVAAAVVADQQHRPLGGNPVQAA